MAITIRLSTVNTEKALQGYSNSTITLNREMTMYKVGDMVIINVEGQDRSCYPSINDNMLALQGLVGTVREILTEGLATPTTIYVVMVVHDGAHTWDFLEEWLEPYTSEELSRVERFQRTPIKKRYKVIQIIRSCS
jgi:ribosomal protein L21E